MRRFVLRACAGLLATAQASAALPGPSFDLVEPAPGVFVHIGQQVGLQAPGHDDIANIGFVVGSRCVAVVDTGGSVNIGRALRTALRQRTQSPVCFVINTHVHFDHVLGNAAFAPEHPHYVGSAALPAAMARNREFFLSHYRDALDPGIAAEAQIIAPDLLVARQLTLDLGGRRLLLRAWPIAHTDCDLTVFDEHSGTLWTGDLLFLGRLPAVDGSVSGWLAVIDELARQRVRLAIPGHGGPTAAWPSALAPERRYLRSLETDVRSALARGDPLQEAIEHVASGERSHWLLWNEVHPRNVVRTYEALEWQ